MTLTLPPGDFQAYLFDCDGTIADSMPLHFIAWDRALREAGCTSFTEELFYGWGGWPVEAVVNELWQRDGRTPMTPAELEAFAHRKEGLYYDLMHQLQPVPEDLEVIQADYGKLPFAVVSRLRKGGRLLPDEAIAALNFLTDVIERMAEEPLTTVLLQRAAMLGTLYSLRALDAIHLASAVVVRNLVAPEEMRFVCSDKELIEAAQKEGFAVWNPLTDEA